MISEWTNYNPNNINRMLHNANDWAAIKNATQSYAEVLFEKAFLKQKSRTNGNGCWRWTLSDVYYDKILLTEITNRFKTVDGKPEESR